MEANINMNTSDQKHWPMKRMMNKGSNIADSEDDDKRKAKRGGGSASSMKTCQAERCSADLSEAKTYHRRHKVCEHHAKAQVAVVAGIRQRFCQQCSRFHELSEFDDSKRSCRRRLAGHNERRRKNFTDSSSQSAEDPTTSRIKDNDIVPDDRGMIQLTVQDNANYKHFHVMR